MAFLRPLIPLLLCTAAFWANGAGAQVVRCVDATGSVSYTDGGCARGDRRSEVVLGPEATQRSSEPGPDRRQEQLDSVERAARLQRESVETVQRQSVPAGGSGLVVIDPRADQRAQAEREQAERRQREAASRSDEVWLPGDAVGGYAPRPAAAPRDMRPRLRQCDAAGCRDNMGNHYDPKGNVDRFVRPDGRTCRPVNSTVVCQ